MKKFICTLCMMSLLLSSASALSPADASAEPAPNVLDQKLALMEYAEEYMAAHPQTRSQVLTPEEEMDLIIECEKQNLSYEEKKEILNPVGIFQLNPDEDHPDLAVPLNNPGTSDVVINKPYIYLATTSYSWYVTMSGYWTDPDPWYTFHLRVIGDVGGADSFGVGYTNVSGSCPARVSARGWMDDGSAHEKSTVNVSYSSENAGVGFSLQDNRTKDGSKYYSVGKRFGCSVQYPATFGSFHGTATSYYVHTWDTAVITGIGFNVSGGGLGGGFNISIANPEYSLTAYSGTQTTF